jgi:hypothetical protein
MFECEQKGKGRNKKPGVRGIVLQSHRYKFEKPPVLYAEIRRLSRHLFSGKNGPKDS